MNGISLQGRVAVVTGAGRELGLGRAYALELARRGAAVVVNDPLGVGSAEGPAADRVVEEIRAGGGRAVASYASVATEAGGEELTAVAVAEFGTVDVVVHNAGTWRNVDFGELSAEKLDPVLDVHLRGGFFVTRPAWKRMLEQGYGRIVLTCSPAGFFGRLGGANYSAAKCGLYGLCRALSLEGAERGVYTNCIVPIARTTTEEERARLGRVFEPALAAASAALAGRNEPERVASLLAYLASERCETSGGAFSAIAGHYARIVVGITGGWASAADHVASAEELAAHWPEIEQAKEILEPASVTAALEEVARLLHA